MDEMVALYKLGVMNEHTEIKDSLSHGFQSFFDLFVSSCNIQPSLDDDEQILSIFKVENLKKKHPSIVNGGMNGWKGMNAWTVYPFVFRYFIKEL